MGQHTEMYEHYQVSNQRLLWWAAQQPASALSIPLAMLLPYRTVHRRVSFVIKARRSESLLAAFKSLFFKAIMAGLPQAGFWLGRQRPWPGILAEEHITYIHYPWDGTQCFTQAIPLLRLHGCFLYFHRRLPLSSSHGPLPLTCLLWIKKNTIAIRPQREQLRS